MAICLGGMPSSRESRSLSSGSSRLFESKLNSRCFTWSWFSLFLLFFDEKCFWFGEFK
ncbi:hypothetical protein LguiB_030031 [Lonicera macranthoides]